MQQPNYLLVALVVRVEVMTNRGRKKQEKAKSSSKQKGELVERIVAMMHEGE